MAEYIEREAANALLLEECSPKVAAYLIDAVAAIPAADVRPAVRATWIVKEMQALFSGMDEHPVFACSECGYQMYDLLDNLKERHHFCPNCGADMREEGE